jgi:hypothetical protein
MKKSYKLKSKSKSKSKSNLMNYAIFLTLLFAFVAPMAWMEKTEQNQILLTLFTLITFTLGTIYYIGLVKGIIFTSLVILFNPITPMYKMLLGMFFSSIGYYGFLNPFVINEDNIYNDSMDNDNTYNDDVYNNNIDTNIF